MVQVPISLVSFIGSVVPPIFPNDTPLPTQVFVAAATGDHGAWALSRR